MGACPAWRCSACHPAVRCYSSGVRCATTLRDIRYHRWRMSLEKLSDILQLDLEIVM
jgi:hypothetical protein